MSSVSEIALDDLKAKLRHQAHISLFQQKVLAVLLGEVLSSTVYEILSAAMAGDESLSNAQALIARSIYAVLISIYSPAMGWLLSKRSHDKDTFFATVMKNHAAICPILLAWGWKNWAAALETFAGADLWDEVVVALFLTVFVSAAQSAPCFGANKAKIMAGGDEATLMARFMVLPSSFGLTLGYVWNAVTTYFVGKLQQIYPHFVFFNFAIQFTYTFIAAFLCTAMTMQLKNRSSSEQDPHAASKTDAPLQQLNSWSGLTVAESNLKDLACTVLSFVYGWALLDLCNNFAFNTMFRCSSYSTCSYQSNFAYAFCVTLVFTASSSVLHMCERHADEDAGLMQAIELQIHAMILTVGWAWMNFYSTLMSNATSPAHHGVKVFLYVISLFVIFVFNSVTEFVLQKAHNGHAKKLKHFIEELGKSGAREEI